MASSLGEVMTVSGSQGRFEYFSSGEYEVKIPTASEAGYDFRHTRSRRISLIFTWLSTVVIVFAKVKSLSFDHFTFNL